MLSAYDPDVRSGVISLNRQRLMALGVVSSRYSPPRTPLVQARVATRWLTVTLSLTASPRSSSRAFCSNCRKPIGWSSDSTRTTRCIPQGARTNRTPRASFRPSEASSIRMFQCRPTSVSTRTLTPAQIGRRNARPRSLGIPRLRFLHSLQLLAALLLGPAAPHTYSLVLRCAPPLGYYMDFWAMLATYICVSTNITTYTRS